MTNKAFDLQREVKVNAEEYQTYLKELYRWEDEIKVKDESLKSTSRKQQPEQPIRGESTGVTTNMNAASLPKTNGDAGNLIMENHTKQKAIIEKTKGNQFFKELQYEKAITSYSAAIDLCPNDAALFANRAIAYLKINKFKETEEDCNRCLGIDPDYVKAYHRRGVARQHLGKMSEAIKDFEEVLVREPHNKAAQVELQRLKSSSCKNSDKDGHEKVKGERTKLLPEKREDTRKAKIVEITEKPKQPSAQPSLEVVRLTHPSLTTVESFSNLPLPAVSEPRQSIKIVKVNDDQQEKRVIEKIIKQFDEKHTIPEAPAQIEVVQKSASKIIPAVPKHYAQFNQEWNKLRGENELRFSYLKKITPSKLPEIFRESLESDILGEIVSLLRTEFLPKNEPVYPWLQALSQVKRIRAVVLFLPSDLKSELASLTKSLPASEDFPEEDRQSVLQAFGV